MTFTPDQVITGVILTLMAVVFIAAVLPPVPKEPSDAVEG